MKVNYFVVIFIICCDVIVFCRVKVFYDAILFVKLVFCDVSMMLLFSVMSVVYDVTVFCDLSFLLCHCFM